MLASSFFRDAPPRVRATRLRPKKPKTISRTARPRIRTSTSKLGSKDAKERLQRAGIADAEKVQAFVAALAHVLPAVHEYFKNQYLYFSTLDTPHKSQYLCKVLASTAVNVILTFPAASQRMAATLVQKLESINMSVARVAKLPGRVGTAPVTMIDDIPGFALSQSQRKFVQEGEDLWQQLLKAKDKTNKKRLVRELVDQNNPAHELGKVGSGNCQFAALNTLVMLASGHLACPLPYWNGVKWETVVDDLANTGTLARDTPWLADVGEIRKVGATLEEGQLALLFSEGFKGEEYIGHAKVLTKLDGELIVVNNQGWNVEAAVGSFLQNLDEWHATWTGVVNSKVQYRIIVSTDSIPFTP